MSVYSAMLVEVHLMEKAGEHYYNDQGDLNWMCAGTECYYHINGPFSVDADITVYA